MPTVSREDPYGAFNFRVEIGGVSEDGTTPSGSFSEVSGLEVEIGVIEYRNGSEDITPRKLPGLVKYSNLQLKRGVTGDVTFWRWIADAIRGRVQRSSMAIVLMDEERNDVMRWRFSRAWPVKYTGPEFNAANNEVAIETLEIAHEGMWIDDD
ncbi:MAG: phage tail protein [Pseudomonadota bacterium]